MRVLALVVIVAAVAGAASAAAARKKATGGAPLLLSVEDMRVENMPSPKAVDPSLRGLTFSWQPAVSNSAVQRGVAAVAYRVVVRALGGKTIWDSGKVQSSEFRHEYAGPELPEAARLEWGLQWWEASGQVSKMHWSPFGTGLRDWGNSSWIGGPQARMLRKEFTISSPQQTTVFISGVGFFQLYVNGLRIDTGVLSGTWTTYNKRVDYFTYDISSILKVGKNAIGVMLGRGWRNLESYPVLYDASPCDKNELLVRAALVANGQVVVGTDSTWEATSNGPITMDSIYNGETYDARYEQTGWDQPDFVPPPSSGWAAANVISCFNPAMTPIAFPDILVDTVNRPVRIYKPSSDCPDGIIGAMVGENTNLSISCVPGTGVISNILFASFGTPTGGCGQYQVGSCNAADSLRIVKAACEGKASCVIPATNDFFGGDPCLNTVKSLAVMANGCSSASSDNLIVDFGENLSGWLKLRVKGKAGTTVTMAHAEVLQHPPYGPVNGDIYNGNLRSAQATDTYILKGDPNGEIFEPHFTYHGFQYVRISGYPGNLTADDITQIHFRTLNEVRTKFNSSSPILNAIQNNALKGQGSNMMSVPTDCDQRDERLGWMGDADLTADSFAINYDFAAFQDGFLVGMVDSQPADGSLPDVVPFVRYGNRPADVSWSGALPQNVYARYKYNGDTKPALQHWDDLNKYFGNLAAQFAAAGGNFVKWNTPYGDWVPAGPKVANQLCTGYSYIVNAAQMAELASVLNKTADAQAYTALVGRLLTAYNSAFYHQDRNCWDNCVQSGYAMSLMAGAVTGASATAALNAMINDIVTTQKNHVTVGIIGAKAMFKLLQTSGHVQVGVDLAEQTTQPSWGYMIYNDVEPATSNLWELWDSPTQGPGMNSRNHHMFSSISAFIVTAVSGISDISCRNPLSLRPAQAFGISRADTTVKSVCGPLSVSYARAGTQQCAKVPEGRSASRPILNVVEDVVLSCGEHGGSISSVDFASWGLPDGTCGAFVANGTCDVDVTDVVRGLCLGKTSCALPASGDAWPASRCPGVSRLFAQVTCSGAHAVVAEVTVPVAVPRTEVLLPLFSASPEAVTVLEGPRGAERVIYSNGAFVGASEAVRGVRGVRVVDGNAVVSIGSGSYSLRLLSA